MKKIVAVMIMAALLASMSFAVSRAIYRFFSLLSHTVLEVGKMGGYLTLTI